VEPTLEQAYRRRIAELEAEVADLKAQVVRLSEQVARLSKNSSNSAKPPSSDIVKPPPQAKGYCSTNRDALESPGLWPAGGAEYPRLRASRGYAGHQGHAKQLDSVILP
jgi:hypothetical protein